MTLLRPILRNMLPFPASTQQIFTFYYDGGNQAIKNQLVIERTSNNSVVYSSVRETFRLEHILQANVLNNGVEYRAKIRVGDINDNWSEYSDYIIFRALSSPLVEITNIDYENQNRVYNQTIDFQATYYQAENEVLQSYRFILYDSNQNIIQSFPERFSNGNNQLSQEIANLENGVLYYIEAKTISVNGALGSSGLIYFRPFYVEPRLSVVLTPENLSEQGSIKLSANILQIIGKLYNPNGSEINPSVVEFIGGERIDLTRTDYHKLVFDEGFDIFQSNFFLKIWVKNIPDNLVFLKLFSANGRIELIKYDNRIHAFKYYRNTSIKPHFASNELKVAEGEDYLIYLKQENHLIDLIMEKVV